MLEAISRPSESFATSITVMPDAKLLAQTTPSGVVETFAPGEEVGGSGGPRVDDLSDTIRLPYEHGLASGDSIIYDAGGGTAIEGLVPGETYYALIDTNTAQTSSACRIPATRRLPAPPSISG